MHNSELKKECLEQKPSDVRARGLSRTIRESVGQCRRKREELDWRMRCPPESQETLSKEMGGGQPASEREGECASKEEGQDADVWRF